MTKLQISQRPQSRTITPVFGSFLRFSVDGQVNALVGNVGFVFYNTSSRFLSGQSLPFVRTELALNLSIFEIMGLGIE